MSKLLDDLLKPRRKADEPAAPQIEDEATEFDFGENGVDMKTVFFGDDSRFAEVEAGGVRQEQSGVVYESPGERERELDAGHEIRTNSGDIDFIHAIEAAVDNAFVHHMQENSFLSEISKALAPERLVAITNPGAKHFRGGQFMLTTQATQFVPLRLCEKRDERRSITLTNNSGQPIFVGDNGAIGVDNYRLISGAPPLVIATRGEVWVGIGPGVATSVVDWFELYDDPQP